MRKKRNRFLSVLLTLVLLIGLLPSQAFATEAEGAGEETETTTETQELSLGDEIGFEVSDPDISKTFTFTAPADGTYILYFENISKWPIAFSFNGEATEYHHPSSDFQGHIVNLNAGESASLTFGYPGDYESLENYSGFSGTVGVCTKAAEDAFDFYGDCAAPEGPDYTFPMSVEPPITIVFLANSPFCYGVDWSIEIADTDIIDLDTTASSENPTCFDAAFVPKNVGETTVTISATYGTKTVSHDYTFQIVDESSGDNGGSVFTFSSFEELSELLSSLNMSEGESFSLDYTGDEALVITGDLTIPSNVNLNCESLTVNGSLLLAEQANLNCESLTVNGSLNLQGFANIRGALMVSDAGNMICSDSAYLGMNYPAAISGLDKIQFANDWQTIEIFADADASSLPGILSQMSEDYIADERVSYHVTVANPENPEAAQTLTESISIPSHVRLNFWDLGSFTVAEGVTVSNAGEISIGVPVILNGTLANQGNIWISHNEYNNGSISFGNNAELTGAGEFTLYIDKDTDPSSLLSGLNLDGYELESDDMGEEIAWHLHSVAGLIKLGMPTELTWGIRYEDTYDYDEENDKVIIIGTETVDQLGIMAWKTATPDQAQTRVKIYKAAEGEETSDTLVAETWCGFDPEIQPEYRSIEDFILQDLESGTYYFTVQSMGDYETYCNSDIAKSGTYTYVRPEEKLECPTNLQWVDKKDFFVSWANFTLPENLPEHTGYEINFFYSPTEDGEYEQFAGQFSVSPYNDTVETELPLEDMFLQEKGVGFYKFRVRLLSPDIESICNSDWSELSDALDVQTIAKDINAELDDILNNTAPEDIRTAVQALDTDDLRVALVTDQENSTTTAMVAELENQVGGPADIVVTPSASAFHQSEVAIVGANLNTNTSEDPEANPITLVIDKPAANHVIPELYDSSVAVKFSMTLTNVADPENLEVPVKITLPVPDSINPEFLVIFHYHLDGSHELIHPYVHEEDGKFFADFVLTSFSDFIMTQELSSEPIHEHVFDQEVAEAQYLKSPADCTSPAVYYKSCSCGEAGSETFTYGEALGHAFDGSDKTICSRCGYKQASEGTDPAPIDPAPIDPTPADPTPTDPPQVTQTTQTQTTQTVETGDATVLWFWYVLSAGALLGMAGLLVIKRKSSSRHSR